MSQAPASYLTAAFCARFVCSAICSARPQLRVVCFLAFVSHVCLETMHIGEQWVTDLVKPVFPPGTGCKVTVYMVQVVPKKLYSSVDRLSHQVFSAVLPQNGVCISSTGLPLGESGLRAGLPMKAASPVLYPLDHAGHPPCAMVLSLET